VRILPCRGGGQGRRHRQGWRRVRRPCLPDAAHAGARCPPGRDPTQV